MDEAALARIEGQRLELEGQIAQLRKSLRHWQILEIDYEGLTEEFSLLPEACSTEQALEVAKDFAAELVDEKEVRTLLGVDKGVRRTPNQVVDLLSKRIDYVSKNAFTIKKQLSDAEKKRNALLLVKQPDYRDEAGLPLTEVTEELDDDGNVVSSKLETVKSAAPQLMEVLKIAGVDHLIEKNGIVTTSSESDAKQALNIASQPASLKQDHKSNQVEKPETQEIEPRLPMYPKEELKSSPTLAVPQTTVSATEKQVVQGSPQEHLEDGLDNDTMPDSIDFPTNPDDTEEDAALRREMLEYAHSEIGPIVAQLELEEGASDISYDEDEDQFSLDSELDNGIDDEEESEDEYGQTKNPVISSRYRKKMEELEKKLGLKGMQNLGPEPDLPSDVTNDLNNKPPAAEAARKAAIKRAEAAVKATDKDIASGPPLKKSAKKVSFAKDLDIAQDADLHPEIKPQKTKGSQKTSLPPISGSVIEREPTAPGTDFTASPSSQPRKPSRFKATRDATPQTTLFTTPEIDIACAPAATLDPAPPTNEVMSADVKERPEPSNLRKAPAPGSHNVDEALHKQEIAAEYYKSRNKMIQRQGGFVHDGEDDNYGEFIAPLPIPDEETGKVKKVSRFKAARLK